MSRPRTIDRDKVAQLAAEGKNGTEIARILGCTPRQINVIRRQLGIPGRAGRPSLTPETKQAIEAALADGWSLRETVRTYGHHRYIYQHYKGQGWTQQQGGKHGFTVKTLGVAA